MKIKRKSSTEGQDGVWGGSGGKKIFFASWQQQTDLKVGHALVWHVLESKLSSFMQITKGNFPFKLTFNKVISLAKKEIIPTMMQWIWLP